MAVEASASFEGGPLKVLIIGAGVGGLSAALALRRQGHHILLFERSKFSSEIGAAIHVAPNCNRLLTRLGLSIADCGGTPLQRMNIYTPAGDLTFTKDLTDFNKASGTEYNLVHRAKLHSELRRLATSVEGLGSPAKLFLDCKLVDLDIHEPSVKLATGETIVGDIIIGADGIHSWSRSFITPRHVPFPYGKACFRWLGKYEELASDPETNRYAGTGFMSEWAGPDRRIIYYPCSNHTIANYAAFVPADEVGTTEQAWDNAASKDLLLKCFESFGPSVRRILGKVSEENLKIWTLMDMDYLPTWTHGLAALIGDAAHPFLPFMAQGGAMAIEDSASLAALLPLGTARSDIHDRLRLYEQCRKDRVERIQDFTRKNGMDPGRSGGSRPSPQESTDFMTLCFDHDEWEHSLIILRQHLMATHRT